MLISMESRILNFDIKFNMIITPLSFLYFSPFLLLSTFHTHSMAPEGRMGPMDIGGRHSRGAPVASSVGLAHTMNSMAVRAMVSSGVRVAPWMPRTSDTVVVSHFEKDFFLFKSFDFTFDF